ncbi:MAG: hypothetical protein JXK07_07915, partial [Spirochaetes bacterium]|nr:hypothetical protein [Spirochaetota bacterium]
AMKLREEGKLEGIEEGIQKGIQKGMKVGVTKGKAEGKLETARAMLKDGFSIDNISKYTGLSEKEIESLE